MLSAEPLFRRVLQVKRHLALDGKGFHNKAGDLYLLIEGQRKPRDYIEREDIEYAILFQHGEHARICVEGEALPFPQCEKARDVVDVGICEDDSRDWRVPRRPIPAGCSSGVLAICWRKSGDAFTIVQRFPLRKRRC